MSLVISKIEKEFIFKFFIHNKINLEVKCAGSSIYAIILEQNSREIKIELASILEEMLIENAKIDIFFYFQNNYHKFKSNVIKMQGNVAIIKNSENITKNLQRKYERVYIGGKLQLEFKIIGDLVPLNFPRAKLGYYPNRPPIDALFFDIKIDKILKKFHEKMLTLVSDSKIKMLRNYTPKTFEEKIVINYGRTLYIPNIHSEIPQKQILPNIPILLKAEWIKHEILQHKTQPYLVNNALSDRLKSMSENNIFSEAIFPVLYKNYVVALIYLVNYHQLRKPISLNILNYTHQFTRVLSYALKENDYFKEEEKNTKTYTVPIYDLSPGGLAFINNDDFFADKLLLNHNIHFQIEINNISIKILAKLIRKFKKLDNCFYGFVFMDIKKDDHDFLIKYLDGIKNNVK